MIFNADALTAYNFFARRVKAKTFETVADFEAAVVAGACNKSCLPSFRYQPVRIDTLKPVSSIWSANYGVDFVKVAGGEVTEYYRKVDKPDHSFESYDLATGEVLDHYTFENGTFIKHGADGVRMFDTAVRYDAHTDSFSPPLPPKFSDAVKQYPHRGLIFVWTERGYADVVYVSEYLEQV